MIKGILFDKDGTLLKFDLLWVQATNQVLPEFLDFFQISSEDGRVNRLKQTLGIIGDTITGESPLAWMSYWDMAKLLAEELRKESIILDTKAAGSVLERLYSQKVMAEDARIEPTADYIPLFKWLKEQNIIIGIATADTREVTMRCLKELGIEKYFSYIGVSEEGIAAKPYTDLFDAFHAKYSMEGAETIIVGDTPVDMEFAKNCGAIAVGVLSGTAGRKELERKAVEVAEG